VEELARRCGVGNVGLDLGETVSAETRRLQASVADVMRRMVWGSVRVSEGAVRRTELTSRMSGIDIERVAARRNVEVTMAGLGGASALVGVGAAAVVGAVGAFLLGPVGWIGAGIGLLFGAAAKRGAAIGRARRAIAESAAAQAREGRERFEAWRRTAEKRALAAIEASFRDHHGMAVEDMPRRALDADRTMNRVGVWPAEKRRCALPRDLSSTRNLSEESFSVYYRNVCELESEWRAAWNAAVISGVRKAAEQVVRRIVMDPDGRYGAAALRRMVEAKRDMLVRKLEAMAELAQPWEITAGAPLIEVGVIKELSDAAPSDNEIEALLRGTWALRPKSFGQVQPVSVVGQECRAGVEAALKRVATGVPRARLRLRERDRRNAAKVGVVQLVWTGPIAGIAALIGGWCIVTMIGVFASGGLLFGALALRVAAAASRRRLKRMVCETVGSGVRSFCSGAVQDALDKEFPDTSMSGAA